MENKKLQEILKKYGDDCQVMITDPASLDILTDSIYVSILNHGDEEFFKKNGNHFVQTGVKPGGINLGFTIEELYQMFKKRIILEISLQDES